MKRKIHKQYSVLHQYVNEFIRIRSSISTKEQRNLLLAVESRLNTTLSGH